MMQTDIEDPEYLGRAKHSKARPAPKMIKVRNKDLLPVLARAASVAGRSDTMPILACVMLTSGDGEMMIEGNNLEMAIKDSVPAECASPGLSACVNAATLLAVAQRLDPAAEIWLEVKDATVIVRSPGVRLTLASEPVSEFPIFREGHLPARFSMPAATLGRMLANVQPFISAEKTRYYFCGVHVFISSTDDARCLRVEASNGAELGIVRIPVPDGADDLPDIDIPAAAIGELIGLLGDGGEVEIAASGTMIAFRVGAVTLLSKLIAATFPDCDRVTPRDPTSSLDVRKPDFLRALALARIVDTARTPCVKLEMAPGKVVITAGTAEKNQVVTELEEAAFEYSGEPLTIAFWNRSLAAIAGQAGRRIVFNFHGPEAACLARDPDDGAATYVAMATRW